MKNITAITIRMTDQQRSDLKIIIKILGFQTVAEWARNFIRENQHLIEHNYIIEK